MNTFNLLKNTLDSMSNNEERKNYIESVRQNPLIGRHDLLRIACNIVYDENFIDSYYKDSFTDSVKNKVKKVVYFFTKFLKKG